MSQRTIVFVAPFPAETTLRFCQAAGTLPGIRLVGIFQKPPTDLARHGIAHLELLEDVFQVDQLTACVRRIQTYFGNVTRVIGVLEDLQIQLAAVRERLGIEGPDVRTATCFREKAVMKDVLRAAGLPCARHRMLTSPQDLWDFVEEVGFPVVVKPPAGAGCRATWRVTDPQTLAEALADTRPRPERPVLAEEFLTGAEYSCETLVVDGVPRMWSITRYYPSPLEVMEKDWIQWCVIAPRERDTPLFERARDLSFAAIKAFGLRDGLTHMEWFHRPDGSLAIGEIAARPPGARIVQLTGLAHGCDMHRVWARAVVDRAFDGPFPRKAAAGVAFLRGQGKGRVSRIEGLDEAQHKMGALVVDRQLPRVGAPRADGYEGEGWVVVQDGDTDRVRRALFDLITTVKVHYA
jgi:formate-dependent phosphoribosylglycinamide formyltransferase (GAR transformylase)